MNIMFVFYKPIIPDEGGVQRVTDILAKELIYRGHKVIFLCHSDKDLIKNDRIIASQYYIEKNNRIDSQIAEDLNKIINDEKITHVICQTLDEERILRLLPSSVKKMAVCHVQPFTFMDINRKRIWDFNAKNYRQMLFKIAGLIYPRIYEMFFNKLEKQNIIQSCKYSDLLCFISDKFFPRIKKVIPNINFDKVVAINNPNTFEVDNIIPFKERENIILWVGRVENGQKNIKDFIRMWERLSINNTAWKAIVIGDGSDLTYFKKYVQKRNIPRIYFLGKRNDINEFYKKAKFISVTSYGESWCMVVTEGMAYGCIPLVYNTYETIHDIIDNNLNGIIVEPTPDDMTINLQECIDDEDKCVLLSSSAHEKIKKFSVNLIVDNWEYILKAM